MNYRDSESFPIDKDFTADVHANPVGTICVVWEQVRDFEPLISVHEVVAEHGVVADPDMRWKLVTKVAPHHPHFAALYAMLCLMGVRGSDGTCPAFLVDREAYDAIIGEKTNGLRTD